MCHLKYTNMALNKKEIFLDRKHFLKSGRGKQSAKECLLHSLKTQLNSVRLSPKKTLTYGFHVLKY